MQQRSSAGLTPRDAVVHGQCLGPPAASRDTLITFNLVKHEQRMKEWRRRESPKKKSQNTVLKKWERQVEYFNITRR